MFHVFFEQYLTLRGDCVRVLGTAILLVAAVAVSTLGSLWAASLLMLTLVLTVVDIFGAMWLLGIELNAVSLVNLAASLGISVEFAAHILHAFMAAEGTRRQRMQAAMG